MSESANSRFETPTERLVLIGIISLVLSFFLVLAGDTHPFVFIAYLWTFYFVGYSIGTENGRESFKKHWKDAGEQNIQQRQVGGNSEPTRICPDCGWKNPESNNYCNDCGYELNE